ncbi:MAG: nitroreductase family protein [Bacillota bacterium]
MTFLELAKKRYSARKYQNVPVEEEKIRYILEAGRVAPSAANLQPWYFVVIRDGEMRRKVGGTYHRDFILQAPVLIAICGDHSKSWRRADGKDFCDQDAAIAVTHMILAAAEQGLGTCWIGAFDSMQCHKALGLPGHIEVIALLPLGYPADEGNPDRHDSGRKRLEEIMRQDGWKES